jgi:hypothetical protein
MSEQKLTANRHLSDEGPAGPTAFWKVSNEIDKEREDNEEDDGDSVNDLDFIDDGDDEDDEHIHIYPPASVVAISQEEEVED